MGVIMIEQYILGILKEYNINDEEVLANTPKRVDKAFREQWQSLLTPPPKLAFFECIEGQKVIISDIFFTSTCEHHLMPFFGYCDIELVSSGITLGLSKFNRLVQYFSAKPTIQEKFTKELYDFLLEKLKPNYLKITIKAEHTCVKLRGIKDRCSNTTTIMEYKK